MTRIKRTNADLKGYAFVRLIRVVCISLHLRCVEELSETNHSPKASSIYIKIKKDLREVCTNFVAN